MAIITSSKAYRYVVSKGWSYRDTGDQLNIETCPLCHKADYKFYMAYSPEKDGCWNCFKCQENGNLYQLRQVLGDSNAQSASIKEAAQHLGQSEEIPNVEAFHKALLAEAESEDVETPLIDHLVTDRGFSLDAISHFKIGTVELHGKKWISYPFLDATGKATYLKLRTAPEFDKDFLGTKGREPGLFNQSCLTGNMEAVYIFEGESDAITAWSVGITNAVGVPGASIKKANWISLLDDLAPKTIYICYDNDRPGQKGASDLANRIATPERVRNLVAPRIEYMLPDGEVKETKDWGEAFVKGGLTLKGFLEMAESAKPFPVQGVCSTAEALQTLKDQITERGSLAPKYKTPWTNVNQLVGMEEGDVVAVLAPAKQGKTTTCLNMLDGMSTMYNESAFLYCLEMMPERLVKKWLCMVTDTDDKDISLETIDIGMGIAANREADLLFGFTPSRKIQDVCDTIRHTVRRYGCKFVCLDNLQMLVQSQAHTAQEISIITKTLKALAMELRIVLFLIIQPKRIDEDQVANSDHAEGSSAPSKDCDAFLCLYRKRMGRVTVRDLDNIGIIEQEESFSPEMMVNVDLSRYSSGGIRRLWFDGAKSKVTENPPSTGTVVTNEQGVMETAEAAA